MSKSAWCTSSCARSRAGLRSTVAPHPAAAAQDIARAYILAQYFHVLDADDAATVREKVAGASSRWAEKPTAAWCRSSPSCALPADNAFHGLPVNEHRQQVVAALLWLGRRVAADRPLGLSTKTCNGSPPTRVTFSRHWLPTWHRRCRHRPTSPITTRGFWLLGIRPSCGSTACARSDARSHNRAARR